MRKPRASEAGFTLIEAMTAIVILVFGLMAVTNLMIVAASSNQIANQTTGAAAVASQVMENLKATTWASLVPGGNIAADVGATAVDCGSSLAAGVYNCDQDVPGVGRIHVRWQILPVVGNQQLLQILVRAEAAGVSGSRTRAEFATFRACTTPILDTNDTCQSPPCCPSPP
jgi:type II secretory pathway pseudopilin PulG